MRTVHDPAELDRRPRAVAIGVFDGVHRGHQAVLRAAVDTGLAPTAITFDPHPRLVLGYGVELLSTLQRRLELFEQAGVEETVVLEFTHDLQQQEPEEFAQGVLRRIGAEVVVAGEDFRFGHRRRGDLAFLEEHGFSVVRVAPVEAASSTRVRELLHEGDVVGAAQILGRPPEVDGVVVVGDERGGTLGFPTANLSIEPHLIVPAFGIYAGAALGGRAAVSIGTNPHYGGLERRIEAHLLDFEGDLYGQRLVVELWRRLRDERAFASEAELVEQIARDVEADARGNAPSLNGVRRPRPARVGGCAPARDETHSAEIVVPLVPAAHRAPCALQLGQRPFIDAGLGVEHMARRMNSWPVDRCLRLELLIEDAGRHRG